MAASGPSSPLLPPSTLQLPLVHGSELLRPKGPGGGARPPPRAGPRGTGALSLPQPCPRGHGTVSNVLPGILHGLRTCAETQNRLLLHPLPACPAPGLAAGRGSLEVGCKSEEMGGGGHPARKLRLCLSVLHRHSSPPSLHHVGASPASCPRLPHQLPCRLPAPGCWPVAGSCSRLRSLPWSCHPWGLLAGPGGSAFSSAPGPGRGWTRR